MTVFRRIMNTIVRLFQARPQSYIRLFDPYGLTPSQTLQSEKDLSETAKRLTALEHELGRLSRFEQHKRGL